MFWSASYHILFHLIESGTQWESSNVFWHKLFSGGCYISECIAVCLGVSLPIQMFLLIIIIMLCLLFVLGKIKPDD